MTEETIVGVAPVQPVASAARPVRSIGSTAEAALKERWAKAQGEQLVYVFRGVEYKILTPMPAAFMVHAGSIQSGEDVDMREFVAAIKSAFVGQDGDNFIKAVMDTGADIVADAEFANDVLSDIVSAVSGRPPIN